MNENHIDATLLDFGEENYYSIVIVYDAGRNVVTWRIRDLEIGG